jgi:hypothetical protein
MSDSGCEVPSTWSSLANIVTNRCEPEAFREQSSHCNHDGGALDRSRATFGFAPLTGSGFEGFASGLGGIIALDREHDTCLLKPIAGNLTCAKPAASFQIRTPVVIHATAGRSKQ